MKERLKNLGRILSKDEQKAVQGGVVNGVVCVCTDGTEVGTADCSVCYKWCNNKGGISCSDGDCKDWPPVQQ